MFRPMALAFAQIDDPAMLAVLWRSLVLAALCFVALLAGIVGVIHHGVNLHGWWAWAADLVGGIGSALLAFWLFLPVATGIGMLFLDRIAAAVERRFYPFLPPPRGAPLGVQIWDGVMVGLSVLVLNILALPLVFLLPGVGAVLAWAVAAWAIGRGLFVGVAMRRMGRDQASALYRQQRPVVLVQGALLALAGYVPVLNLVVPMLGAAAMVHILDQAVTAPAIQQARAGRGLF